MNHPVQEMSEIELLEMETEWLSLVDEMKLETTLGAQGFQFSLKMFREAYTRGYVKGRKKHDA